MSEQIAGIGRSNRVSHDQCAVNLAVHSQEVRQEVVNEGARLEAVQGIGLWTGRRDHDVRRVHQVDREAVQTQVALSGGTKLARQRRRTDQLITRADIH